MQGIFQDYKVAGHLCFWFVRLVRNNDVLMQLRLADLFI